VGTIIDSAAAEGLAVEPLIQRALEGATKRASGDRIASAVHGLLHRLRTARSTLGLRAGMDELVAGAAALQAGVPASTLAELRTFKAKDPLTIPLVVLANLIGRGVPPETASSTILFMTRAGLDDKRILEFRDRVERDIVSGVEPVTAATIRAGGVVVGGVSGRPADIGRRSP
jgi:hypothetical protein